MATVTFHHTEDSAATVTGTKGSVLVIDSGCSSEVLRKPVPSSTYALVSKDWETVKEFENDYARGLSSYGAAINFAERYVDGKAV